MEAVTAVLSMLHQPPAPTSATRMFRGRSVLAWTLHRLRMCGRVGQAAVLCWEDQLEAVRAVALAADAHVLAKGPRSEPPMLQAISAARRWTNGWRGGLIAASCFDNGFHGPWLLEVLGKLPADAVLLVDPDSALLDPAIVSGLLAHAQAHPHTDFFFSMAAPGLAGMLLREPLLKRLAEHRMYPGQLLNYHPDLPGRDPVASDACAPAPQIVARTTGRFLLDSERQIRRIEAAADGLNGALLHLGAEELVRRWHACPPLPHELPAEAVIELCTLRKTAAIYRPARHAACERPALDIATARRALAELSVADDVRITLGGAGDPLLADQLADVVAAAAQAGIRAMHIETDLLGVDPALLDRLATMPVDVVSVHIPATTAETYARVMGVDGFDEALSATARLMRRRHAAGRLVPLIAPVFVKCRQNLHEMEEWYDHWLRKVGSAVIRGPSTWGGLAQDVAAADMRPPRRVPCRQLGASLVVLSDGRVACCEEDVLARQTCGRLGERSLAAMWREATEHLRRDHAGGAWQRHPACARCDQWHR